MKRKKSTDFDGAISRREFLDDAGKYAVGGLAASAMLELESSLAGQAFQSEPISPLTLRVTKVEEASLGSPHPPPPSASGHLATM